MKIKIEDKELIDVVDYVPPSVARPYWIINLIKETIITDKAVEVKIDNKEEKNAAKYSVKLIKDNRETDIRTDSLYEAIALIIKDKQDYYGKIIDVENRQEILNIDQISELLK